MARSFTLVRKIDKTHYYYVPPFCGIVKLHYQFIEKSKPICFGQLNSQKLFSDRLRVITKIAFKKYYIGEFVFFLPYRIESKYLSFFFKSELASKMNWQKKLYNAIIIPYFFLFLLHKLHIYKMMIILM